MAGTFYRSRPGEPSVEVGDRISRGQSGLYYRGYGSYECGSKPKYPDRLKLVQTKTVEFDSSAAS